MEILLFQWSPSFWETGVLRNQGKEKIWAIWDVQEVGQSLTTGNLDVAPCKFDMGILHTADHSKTEKVQHQAVNAPGNGCSPQVLHQTRAKLPYCLEKAYLQKSFNSHQWSTFSSVFLDHHTTYQFHLIWHPWYLHHCQKVATRDECTVGIGGFFQMVL